jgi:hypothetical protein
MLVDSSGYRPRSRHLDAIQSQAEMGMIGKALIAAALSMLCTSAASAHDWYTGLVDPVTGYSCCGGQDCRPVPSTDIRLSRNGDLELWLDGAWRVVDPQKILKISSPDSRVHACWLPAYQELRCVILPGAL